MLHELDRDRDIQSLEDLIDLAILLDLKLDNVRFPCSADGRMVRRHFIKWFRRKDAVTEPGYPARCYPVTMDRALNPSVECAERELTVRIDYENPAT